MNLIDRLLAALGCSMAGGTSSALACFAASAGDYVLWVEIPAYTCLGAALAAVVGIVSGPRGDCGSPSLHDAADSPRSDLLPTVLAGFDATHRP